MAIFKGKRKLKFKIPDDVLVTVQSIGSMNSDLMLLWFKAVVLPFTKERRVLLVIDSFSAHEDQEFLSEAQANKVL